MRLVILSMIAWCAVAAASAAPARPLYEPPAPPRLVLIDLRNTQWHGTEPADRNIFFHADGSLGYLQGQKSFGTWKITGDTIYFEFNNRYREFRGVIKGNVIQGESWNVTGKRWQTLLDRTPMPKAK